MQLQDILDDIYQGRSSLCSTPQGACRISDEGVRVEVLSNTTYRLTVGEDIREYILLDPPVAMPGGVLVSPIE